MSSDANNPKRTTFILLLASVIVLGAGLFVVRDLWLSGLAKSTAVIAEVGMGVVVVVWAALLWRGVRLEFGRRERVTLLLGAAGLRLILLDLEPGQSDDIYRYLWEGRVQRAGMNPYRHAPDAPELAHLRDSSWERINHREHSAIYPPLTQAVFLLGATLWPTVTMFKLLFVLCDLGVLWLLLVWLARLGRSPAWATLWAFHPLAIVEFSGNGHVDSLMILMVVGSLTALEARRERWALAALWGAVAAKLIPLLVAPFFFWRLKSRWPLALVPLAVALAYLPYAGAGEGLLRSVWVYQRDWLYNSPLFDFARDRLFGADGFLARWWFYGALAALAATLWRLRVAPSAAYLWLVGFYQVAGPVVHPWYLAQFLPLVCVRRGAWPWIGLTVAAPLSYLGESDAAIRWIVWGPFYLGLLVQGVVAFRSRRRDQSDQAR